MVFDLLKEKLYYFCLLFFLLIISFCLFVQSSFARYSSNVDVNVETISGEMICDVEVDTNSSYIENNMAFFRVIVSNSRDDGSITATDIDYTITISNADGSNGMFYYIDSEGIKSSDSNEFFETITSQTYSFGKTKEERVFKVFVKVPSNLKETVNFNVSLNAVQKQMD